MVQVSVLHLIGFVCIGSPTGISVNLTLFTFLGYPLQLDMDKQIHRYFRAERGQKTPPYYKIQCRCALSSLL
jgi:hypothetical protein